MKKIFIIYLVVFSLAFIPLSGIVNAGTVPTISIQGVTEGEKVTILTQNYPANKDFIARMGLLGTKGTNGIVVGSVNSGEGGSQKYTFEISAELQSEDAIAIRLDSTTGGYYSYSWFYNDDFGTHEDGVPAGEAPDTPTITVLSVKEGSNMVVKGVNFPAGETIDILMGKYGTEGINGIIIESIEIAEEGEFEELVNIPESLQSESKITVRFESQDSDLVLFTSFDNTTGASGGSGGTTGYTGIPTITIDSVVEDQEVTVKTHNFPANKEFIVLMGKIGTRGVGGTEVTRIDSGEGESFTETFDIPSELHGLYQIAIRLQTLDGVYYAYNWFYNSKDSAPTVYTGIPTFKITEVVSDESVTIVTDNFPPDYDFEVLLGKMFTRGIGGIQVTTVNSSTGGTLTGTFAIPEELEGLDRIAIRLQSTVDGFYAYNWFYNTTYP